MEREALSSDFGIGSKIPAFALPGTDGKTYSSEYFAGARAALVVFSCNHCPYVKGSEAELIRIHNENCSEGLKTLVINSNDPVKYPEDGFEQMQQKSLAMKLPYPYLFDQTQQVAKLFDAACTPECYLFNQTGQLVYHGLIKGNPKDANSREDLALEKAIKQLLANQPVVPAFVHPLGCSIKWKQS